MKIVIAGGSGFIGRAVIRRLAGEGHRVVVLSRNASSGSSLPGGCAVVQWDAASPGPWTSSLESAGAVINLAGASLASGRWTTARKKEILSSRLNATRAIAAAFGSVTIRPPVLINASAVGYYGDVRVGPVDESFPNGRGFLADVTDGWEREASAAAATGTRVVLLRSGMVLGREAGALPKMMMPFRMFAGGPIGSGNQWISWIHIDDCCSAIVHCISAAGLDGPVNITAPNPVTMNEFSAVLAKTLHRPNLFRVPGFMMKLMLGEMSEMLLTGQRVVPEKLLASGFRFRYEMLGAALAELCGPGRGD